MMSKEPFPNPTNQKWKKADSASHPITSQSELEPVNTGRYVATPHAATPQIRRARTRRPRCSQRLRASDSNHPIRFSDLIQHVPLVKPNKQSNFSGLFHPNLLEPRFGSRFQRRTCARLPHSLILIHAIRKSCSIQISLLGAATKVTPS